MTITDPTTAPIDWATTAGALADRFALTAAENDRTGVLPKENFDALRDAGITAALVPTEFGGGGATFAEMCGILRTLARGCPSTAVTLSMHTHLVAAAVWRQKHGVDASPLLRRVAGDRVILVSTGASDWLESNGTVERVDGGYRVSARKTPASGCDVGDIAVTSLRWDDAPDGPQVIHCAVPFSAEGVSVDFTWDTLGLRATGSHTIVFDNVFVPDAAVSLSRPAGKWHPVFNTVVGVAIPLIMSAYVGIAERAVEIALEGARKRPDAPHLAPLVGEMLDSFQTGVDVVEAMIRDADDVQFANTDDITIRDLSRKTVAVDALIATVRQAIEVTGGMGFMRSSDLERLYRDVHGSIFHPLPRAKQVLLTGRMALGVDPAG